MLEQPREELHRGLKERHIQLIALGGAIGVGLFLGSATAIKTAGPALMLSYIIGGLAIFIIMRALGELAVAYPVAGSFSAYANTFLSPVAGYITGWTYWFMWVVTCMAELTAVGVYIKFWIPGMPQWIPPLIALVLMSLINLAAVKAYGEFEFWFALIKVVTILVMIIVGFGMIFFGIGNHGDPVGFGNLWAHGGFFPNGVQGMIMALIMVMFAYLGIELIGVTAGEAENPQKSIPSAIDKVFYRILIFYVGALLVILSIYPWNEIGTKGSPFVSTFAQIGIPAAAGIINFVVLTAALSSCNSGLFSTGRMLYNLALQKNAPAAFARLSKNGIPYVGIIFSGACLLVAVALNYLVPAQVFVYVTSVATFGAIYIWGLILIVQMKFRRSLTREELARVTYRTPGYPVSNWITLIFLLFVVVLMVFNPDTRVALYVGPVWFILVIAAYYIFGLNHRDALQLQALPEKSN